jgi:hypothetical protein
MHRMKTLIASAVSLLIGLGIGWCIEHRHAEHEMTDAVKLMVQAGESSDCEHAARAVRAVQFIESGDTQRAVQLLSGPIAHYYSVYGDDHSNDERSKVRALIEQVARTNQVVAARIAEASSNTQFRTP